MLMVNQPSNELFVHGDLVIKWVNVDGESTIELFIFACDLNIKRRI